MGLGCGCRRAGGLVLLIGRRGSARRPHVRSLRRCGRRFTVGENNSRPSACGPSTSSARSSPPQSRTAPPTVPFGPPERNRSSGKENCAQAIDIAAHHRRRKHGRAILDAILWPIKSTPGLRQRQAQDENAVLRYSTRASESDQPSSRSLRLRLCAAYLLQTAAAERTRMAGALDHGHKNQFAADLEIPIRVTPSGIWRHAGFRRTS